MTEHHLSFSESEWRTIHNALAVFQCSTTEPERRKDIQRLMDKVRDEAISVILESRNSGDAPNIA